MTFYILMHGQYLENNKERKETINMKTKKLIDLWTKEYFLLNTKLKQATGGYKLNIQLFLSTLNTGQVENCHFQFLLKMVSVLGAM